MGMVQPQDFPAFNLASRAAGTVNSGDIDTTGCNNLNVYTKVTVPNGGSIVVTIQGKDVNSGDYYTILSGTSISTATNQRLKVGPTIAASANAIAQDYLPKTIRISVVVSTAAVTFSVGLSLTD
jgi:hypothetical protein